MTEPVCIFRYITDNKCFLFFSSSSAYHVNKEQQRKMEDINERNAKVKFDRQSYSNLLANEWFGDSLLVLAFMEFRGQSLNVLTFYFPLFSLNRKAEYHLQQHSAALSAHREAKTLGGL